jgi:hypothetical protein
VIICEKYSHFAQSARPMCAQKTLAATMSTLFVPAMSVIESAIATAEHLRYFEENAAATVKSASTQQKSDPSAWAISSISTKTNGLK